MTRMVIDVTTGEMTYLAYNPTRPVDGVYRAQQAYRRESEAYRAAQPP